MWRACFVLLEEGAEPPPVSLSIPEVSFIPGVSFSAPDVAMQQLLAIHRDDRRAREAVQAQADREAAAVAAADALLAEEEAE